MLRAFAISPPTLKKKQHSPRHARSVNRVLAVSNAELGWAGIPRSPSPRRMEQRERIRVGKDERSKSLLHVC